MGIISALAEGEPLSPKRLSEALDEPLGNVSYHVRRLAGHDLVVLVSTAERRGAREHFYALTPAVVAADGGIVWERLVRAAVHPTAIDVLVALRASEPASPVDLARRFEAPVGNVSYHVRELATGGLLELVRTRQRRGATQHFYALAPWVRDGTGERA